MTCSVVKDSCVCLSCYAFLLGFFSVTVQLSIRLLPVSLPCFSAFIPCDAFCGLSHVSYCMCAVSICYSLVMYLSFVLWS